MYDIIQLKGVSKEFINIDNRLLAVNNVDVGFCMGKSISIMGPSGCGKSTLLNLIGLIQQPTSGSILIDSINIADYSSNERAQLRNWFFGYVAQNYLLLDKYTVAENVEIPLLYTKSKISRENRRKKIMNILEKVGLRDKVNVNVMNLSGGEQQRVAIARALVNDAKVILADEPTGALDTNTGNEIINLLLKLVSEGKSLIMVTHNEEIAKRFDIKLNMMDGYLV